MFENVPTSAKCGRYQSGVAVNEEGSLERNRRGGGNAGAVDSCLRAGVGQREVKIDVGMAALLVGETTLKVAQ